MARRRERSSFDNSEYSRNGDFRPSRLQAQIDVITLISRNKTDYSAENVVGLVDLSGPSCCMSLVPQMFMPKLINALRQVRVRGTPKLAEAIQVAQFALKNRQNKRQEQRILIFVTSPLEDSEEQLSRLAMMLKRNNICVDVVSFGEVEANAQVLRAFVEAVDHGGTSHLVEVRHRSKEEALNLVEELAQSPHFESQLVAATTDSADDQILEMVIRMSLEEAKSSGIVAEEPDQGPMQETSMMDEDMMLAQAIALSIESEQHDTELHQALELSVKEAQQRQCEEQDDKEENASSKES